VPIDLGGDKLEVRVHQLVKNLQGDVLSDSEVRHVFSVKDGLIKSMYLKGEEAGSSSGERMGLFCFLENVLNACQIAPNMPLNGRFSLN